MIHTTLALLQQNRACPDRLAIFRATLGPDWPDDKPISLIEALDLAPVEDVIFGLQAVLPDEEPERDWIARTLAIECAERVEHLSDDPRVAECNRVTRRYLAGQATREELEAAGEAAWEAAGEAAWAAWEAAWAARQAAGAAWAAWAAWEAARQAARQAAGAAREGERAWQAARLRELATAYPGEPTTGEQS